MTSPSLKFSIRLSIQIFIFSLLSSFLCAAHAARTVTTFGQRSCLEWLEAQQEASKGVILEDGSMRHMADRSWLAGYVSGLNMGLPTEKNYLKAVDMETVVDWVARFCETNRDRDLPDAVSALFLKLRVADKPKTKATKGSVRQPTKKGN